MLICPNCQTANRAEARFCLSCGVKLDQTPPAALDVSEDRPAGAAAAASQEPVEPAAPDTLADRPVDAAAAASQEPVEPAAPPDALADRPAAAAAVVSQEPVEPAVLGDLEDHPMDAAAASPEPSLGEPLLAGVLLAGRFTIIALLEESPEGRIYSASDAVVCGQCGAMLEPGDRYCAKCGVELTGPALVRLQESAAAPAVGAVEADGRWYALLPAAAPPPAAGPAPHGWRLQVGQASDAGKIRELDEDSVFSLVLSGIYQSRIEPTVGLFLVADGIGGHEGGEVASKLAVQTLAQQVLQRIIWPILQGETLLVETLQAELEQAVQFTNRQIYELRRQRGSDMGATLTMALVVNGLAIIGNVGDSRTYVWGPAGLEQVTTDHSLIAALIAAGQEPPEAVYSHPQRNLITRSLGENPSVQVDLFALELEPGFRLILCCDGVWEMIRDEGIEEVMLQESHPQQAADKIVTWSNNAGGEDNISVVVVAVEQISL